MMNQSTYPDPRKLWHSAYLHLNLLRAPYGFAASDAKTGLYSALFGRDSLWMLIFLLEAAQFHSSVHFNNWVEVAGSDILSNLGALQGTKTDDSIEEQPGKIIHEFRPKLDERLQKMGLVFEGGRSYSGFDQTFLFVTAFRRFTERYPSSPVSQKVWPNVERALSWIEKYADDDGDGLFEYRRRNPKNLLNQVWKDSFDSLVQTGIDIPPHPIAWIEAQAYGYRAFLDAAELYSKRRERLRAEHFISHAQTLRRQVNTLFWLAHENCFAIAVDATKSPITMIGSNASHALWAGIVEPEHERALVNRLLESDLTTEYGIRTLSSTSPYYAPFSYHRGCVWPFDNGVFAMGLWEHGYRESARRVMAGVSTALDILGSPIELYLVLDSDLFVEPTLPVKQALLLRRINQENRDQGWTAATMLYFAAALAEMTGVTLPKE